ncbi:ras-specific guanine nucleotide-releasing factor 2-like [Anopheles ziemanni]|uniref:ras-specific guanine nucleotide-releasing factor 2-like n=1 Tax=Anopheles coustani TaxID=139045 RepID=UPI00265B02B0|nr:ras-specific guanine nucleotide-releasing factor 2-like [Anopheles coustani]XP_058173117.1 ras-specific guanine nucleotide-releasing factor 2-like [Anopheles ziemanni]
MLSPKMQRSVRVNENQLIMLSDRAQYDHSMHGYLHKRTSDNNKWQMRWFVLYQNLLFYYESEQSSRPSGLIFLEGCYCERLVSAPSLSGPPISTNAGQASKIIKEEKLQHCFTICYRRENQRQYELRAATESECSAWIIAIREASFNKLLLQKEELEQKHVHLLQVVESEKTAKWQYTQQCEELASEIRKLRTEICVLRKETRSSYSATPVGRGSFSVPADSQDDHGSLPGLCASVQDSIELRKIKKVQSFFRGWLCRRRWKQIVEEYIRSPHAESMRKRNHLVFSMVEAEEEYLEQLEVLVACFLRPFKMAASSKRPPCSHEDVNSIFLNSETVLFLHQIFLKGLTSRLESWPTLVLGDLFDMLLPMLSIYQEYVRNHHYSLQVLTECKSNTNFATVLKRLEAKPSCQGRSLETFLTYPMHQIPRYIITLHELLAHTPHDHVERKSLQNARQQLEDLSRQMHDEVSETENLRKNLAVERMIVEGCDILLDVNQVFVRQGSLVQVPPGRGRIRSRLASFKSERDAVRQCFLFSNHMIIATRTSGGRLHLLPDVGKIPLADATLVEDPSDVQHDDEEASVCSASTRGSTLSVTESVNAGNRDFKILVESKSGARHGIHLVAPTIQDKEAWISDISQCLDNIHMHSLLSPGIGGSSGASLLAGHQALRADPRLFKDDVDIRFSRTLNSCKLPQVRYATPERLLQRLTDLRFLSIDFLNTFLLTYRVFTDGETVLNALKSVFYDPPVEPSCDCEHQTDFLELPYQDGRASPRRTSGASSVSGYCSEGADRDRSMSGDSTGLRFRGSRRGYQNHQSAEQETLSWIPEQVGPVIVHSAHHPSEKLEEKPIEPTGGTVHLQSKSQHQIHHQPQDDSYLVIPKAMPGSSSSDTLTETVMSGPSSPSNLSSVTLVGSTGSGGQDKSDDTPTEGTFKYGKAPTSPLPERINLKVHAKQSYTTTTPPTPTICTTDTSQTEDDQAPLKQAKQQQTCQEQQQHQHQQHYLPQHQQQQIKLPPTPPTVTTTPCYGPSNGQSPNGHHPLQEQHSLPSPKPEQATIVQGRLEYGGPKIVTQPYLTTSTTPTTTVTITTATTTTATSAKSISPPHLLPTDRRPSVGHNIAIPHAALCQHRHSLQLNGDGSLFSKSEKTSSSPRLTTRKFSAPKTPERQRKSLFGTPQRDRDSSSTRRFSESDDDMATSIFTTPRGSLGGVSLNTISSRASMQHDHVPHCSSKVGVVITSYRQSQRSMGPDPLWSSTSTAAAAFAIATSASSNPRDEPPEVEARNRKESVVSSPATMRVLNVLRHWVSKHFQDFEQDAALRSQTIAFLDDITCSPNLLPTEHRAASQLLRLLCRDDIDSGKQQLEILLTPPQTPSKESIETLSALEIAEQMTYLDHQIFLAIRSEEFLGQAWMKSDKKSRAEHIILMTKRFNDGSRLVCSEIVSRSNMAARVAAIEKWTAVADICRCLHNFNGVLQICAAFTNAAVYRLKKTWDKVPRTIKSTITKLQAVVCSDGRFRVMREALHRCDPPCIPYLGMYLTDLSFIEEGTPDFTPDGLLNFSKMRMIAHVIREIRHFQQTPYKIDHIPKVTSYLLDTSLLLDDDELYHKSLQIEPRSSRLSAPNTANV